MRREASWGLSFFGGVAVRLHVQPRALSSDNSSVGTDAALVIDPA
jgi:hypothetical protein